MALVYARGQVTEARETRERVAQPEVVVYIEQNNPNWRYMDLVIKNFGQTCAYNVRLTLPPLEVVPYDNLATGEHVTTLYVPENIAVLAPGQEWRTVWDSAIRRKDYGGELQSRYVGSVAFDDRMNAEKPSYTNPISLDTKMFWNTMRVETSKSRSSEKALYEIAKTLKGFTSQHSGIWTYSVSGEDEVAHYEGLSDRMQQAREAHEIRMQNRRELNRRTAEGGGDI